MENKIRVALVGTGGIFACHADAYKKLPNVELYAFCDINEELLKKRGEQYNVTRLYTDEATMLAELPEIEVVSICTWNSAHASCAIMALNAGKHVLCEKPMAMNTREAEEMKAAAEKNNKLLMIGFVRRFGSDCSIMQDFINAGDLGDIYYAKATYIRRFGFPGGWFGDKSRSGGGPLIDLGVHVIDLVRYLVGNPKPISVYGVTADKIKDRPGIKAKAGWVSQTVSEKPIFDVEDFASAMIRFENGIVLQVETAFNMNVENESGKIELYGSKAGMVLDPSLKIFTQHNNYLTNVAPQIDTSFDFVESFEREVAHFIDCATNGIPCRNTADDGIAIMKVLDAIYESAQTGHEVQINWN